MSVLTGNLADRDSWLPTGRCPVERTMAVVGTRSGMLIMREAFYGTTRFDDFAQRVGITRAATSARLTELVDTGVLTKRAYREPGQRGRHEYVLTDAGRDLMPVVFGLFQWGQRHLPDPVRLRLEHRGCRKSAQVEIRCRDGHLVEPDTLGVTRSGAPNAHDPS